ncbi:MAG: GTPase Era [Oscillospiraceae bacterium]|jgi:GTP-binding protein Era|nr:GTPase Era [Oscillospiraceae bacterium]
MDTKTAMITLTGRPNAGKSTLINALTGEKIAIVTHKPQTTRGRIFGVVNRGGTQLVFADTPGFHSAKTRLDDHMADIVRRSMDGVDAVALIVEPVAGVGDPERRILERVASADTPALLIINKIDTVKKESLLGVIAAYADYYEFDSIIPVSAKYGDGLDGLLTVFEGYATEGPALFPKGMVTDQSDSAIVAELVREKLLFCLAHEVPHGTAVEITRFAERDDGIIDVEATIYCEKESHKAIIIGKNGEMLKKIGSLARADIERFMGAGVFLKTWVRVKAGWRDSGALIGELGYPDARAD